MILPIAVAEVAMSRTNRAERAGKPMAIGLVPTIASAPPYGVTSASEVVMTMPTIPSLAAASA
jgi:hypothetical protein